MIWLPALLLFADMAGIQPVPHISDRMRKLDQCWTESSNNFDDQISDALIIARAVQALCDDGKIDAVTDTASKREMLEDETTNALISVLRQRVLKRTAKGH